MIQFSVVAFYCNILIVPNKNRQKLFPCQFEVFNITDKFFEYEYECLNVSKNYKLRFGVNLQILKNETNKFL